MTTLTTRGTKETREVKAMKRTITARQAFAATIKGTEKTYYLAMVSGCPEQVSAKGVHRATGQQFTATKVSACDTFDAKVKFLKLKAS